MFHSYHQRVPGALLATGPQALPPSHWRPRGIQEGELQGIRIDFVPDMAITAWHQLILAPKLTYPLVI